MINSSSRPRCGILIDANNLALSRGISSSSCGALHRRRFSRATNTEAYRGFIAIGVRDARFSDTVIPLHPVFRESCVCVMYRLFATRIISCLSGKYAVLIESNFEVVGSNPPIFVQCIFKEIQTEKEKIKK